MTLALDPALRGPVLTKSLSFTRSGAGSLSLGGATPWQSAVVVITALDGYLCQGRATANFGADGPDVDLPLYDVSGRPLGLTEWVEPGIYMVDLRGATALRLRADRGDHGWKAFLTASPDPIVPDLRLSAKSLTPQTIAGEGGTVTHQNTRRWEMAYVVVEEVEGYTCQGKIRARYYVDGPEVDLPLYDVTGEDISATSWTAAGIYTADLRGVVSWRVYSTSAVRGFKATATALPHAHQFRPKQKPRSESQLIILGGTEVTHFQLDDVARFASARLEVQIPADSPAPANFRVGYRRMGVPSGSGERNLPVYRESGVWHDHAWAREPGAFAIDLTNVRRLRLICEAGHYATVLLTLSEDRIDTKPMAMDVGSYRSIVIEAGSPVSGFFSGFEVIEPAVLHADTSYARKATNEPPASRLMPVSPDELPAGRFVPGAFDVIRLVSGRVRAFYR